MRSPVHVLEALRLGADVATIPLKVIHQLIKHPLTDVGLKRFLEDAKTVGIDLADAETIPAKLDASAWPGVPAVFAGLVGALPKELS